jgi:hypothetical protein
MIPQAHLHFGLSLALWMLYPTSLSAQTPETGQRVPLVACTNGQMAAKPQTGQSLPVPLDQRTVALIAYYGAAHTPGVYGPTGWHCQAWFGSNGSILVVTPKPMTPPYFPLPVVTGPAVMIQTSGGQSSGRFHVAIVAAQLFPLLGGEFITHVRQEHLIPDSAFDLEPRPDDQLRYLSDRLAQYTTPQNRAGLGTDGMFEVSNLPIRGLTILNLADDTNTLIEFRVRVPAGLSAVAKAIVQLETACVQRARGCRDLP